MSLGPIRLLEVAGAPAEMGYAHGRAFRSEIRHAAAERVELVCVGQWTGRPLPRADVLALADACVAEHWAYAPDLMRELEGMAAATQLSLAELIILNGFTDFIDTVYNHYRRPETTPARLAMDDCTAIITPDHLSGGQGMLAQTWDMHATATPYVILLRCRPANGLACLTFTLMGCLGMIGMNAAGVAVGINNLVGADGQIGVTWPFVVRRILHEATTAEEALSLLQAARLAGAHNYLLFDRFGHGFNVEAMSTCYHVTELADTALAHTNHCLAPMTQAVSQVRDAESQASSDARLDMARRYIEQNDAMDPDYVMSMLRDAGAICVTRGRPPRFVETCGAAIMRPRSGQMWAVWGLPTENAYECFQV